jgi:hypothetical protein
VVDDGLVPVMVVVPHYRVRVWNGRITVDSCRGSRRWRETGGRWRRGGAARRWGAPPRPWVVGGWQVGPEGRRVRSKEKEVNIGGGGAGEVRGGWVGEGQRQGGTRAR